MALLVGVLSAACGHHAEGSGTEPAAETVGSVVRVVDGDTIDVEVAGTLERVRMLGIDTPEVAKPGTGQSAECHGGAASAYTAALLPPGTRVVLSRDIVGRDHYDRLLAYVHRLDDGVFVNYELVRHGHAEVLHIEPNGIHRVVLADAMAEARRSRVGLWLECGG